VIVVATSPILQELFQRVGTTLRRGGRVAPIPPEALATPLSMAPEHVAARMDALGFRTPVFHATSETAPLERFHLRAGQDPKDIPSVHVGTVEAANDRARQLTKYIAAPDGSVYPMPPEGAPAMHVMPLVARMEKPYYARGRKPFGEEDLRDQVNAVPIDDALRTGRANLDDARQAAFYQRLISQGYDTVPYINDIEAPGSTSYMILRPENLRSLFATFDPAKRSLADLMAQRWIATAGAGGAAAATAGYAAADRGGGEST